MKIEKRWNREGDVRAGER